MNDYNEEPTPVTRQLVPEDQRLAVVEQLFGIHFPLRIEPVVYGITERMTRGQYRGGYWEFFVLDNGTAELGFFMAPDDDKIFTVSCDNFWQGDLSTDALGITACLYAFSHLSFSKNEAFARTCAQHYHLLRAYMMDHDEVASILGAID